MQEYYNTLVNMRRYAFDISLCGLQHSILSAEYATGDVTAALRAAEGLKKLAHVRCVAIVQLAEWFGVPIPQYVRDEYDLDAPYYNCGLVDDH